MTQIPGDYKPGLHGLNKVLGNSESDIMDIIWRKDCEVCVRDIYEELAARREIAYTTVMTIMGRLADKKILQKRKEGNVSYFIPVMTREDFTSQVVGNVVDSLLKDFADVTFSHFLERVKKEDKAIIEKLERLLAEYKKGDTDGAY